MSRERYDIFHSKSDETTNLKNDATQDIVNLNIINYWIRELWLSSTRLTLSLVEQEAQLGHQGG